MRAFGRILLPAAFGSLTVAVLIGAVGVSNDGIHFPDGTVQTTAGDQALEHCTSLTEISPLDPANPNEYLIPHFAEDSTSPFQGQYGKDTKFHILYADLFNQDPPDASIDIDVYLYSEDGTPIENDFGFGLCNPCVWSGIEDRVKRVVDLHELLFVQGQLSAPTTTGSAVIYISSFGGAEPSRVSVSMEVTSSC